jgi:DNA modification methylase
MSNAKVKQYAQVLPLDTTKKVVDQFGWLPVSVRTPEKERNAAWDTRGAYLAAEETRRSSTAKYLPGLRFSEFHAALAEDIVRYWSMPGATVVDPFAGRATRAVVTTLLGRNYVGYEISPATFTKCTAHFATLGIAPTLINKDGTKLADTLDATADLVMTCPPYWNLEKYEAVTDQLSNHTSYADFLVSIQRTATNIARVLKPGAFGCWVCADFRALSGTRKGLLPFHVDSISAFTGAGLSLHDIIIIQNNSPFASLQAGKVAANRYTSKVHEYLLVFRKPTL